MSIPWPTPPGPTPRRGERPEPIVTVRSLANGGTLNVRVSHAATLLADGTVELAGEPTEALNIAIDIHGRIPAVARSQNPR